MFKAMDNTNGQWVKADITISRDLIPNDYNIVLSVDRRRSFQGSIDVDDLKFSNVHCQGKFTEYRFSKYLYHKVLNSRNTFCHISVLYISSVFITF
jgi:hypothetical protein